MIGISVVAGIAAKVVVGTILKTVGIGVLGGASFYGGVKGAKKVDKIIQTKKAEKVATETTYEEPIAEEPAAEEAPVEETVEETVTEEETTASEEEA